MDANREQSPWTADSWNVGNVLLYNHRNSLIVDKIVRDYASEQAPNGDFYACSPAACFHVAEWSMYWPMLLWQQYLFSGDERLLAEMAPRLKLFLAWIEQYQDKKTKLINPPEGSWDGDWELGIRISDYPDGACRAAGSILPRPVSTMRISVLLASIFTVLRQIRSCQRVWSRAEKVLAGINKHLFNGSYYLVTPDRTEMFPLASAWALRFDIVPPEAKPRVLAAIRKAGRPHIGGYGGDAFYSGLLNAGASGDLVIEDLARYRYMIELNHANHESFGKEFEVNHAWTAYPGYLFRIHHGRSANRRWFQHVRYQARNRWTELCGMYHTDGQRNSRRAMGNASGWHHHSFRKCTGQQCRDNLYSQTHR